MTDPRVLITLSTFCEQDDTPRRLLQDAGVPFVEHATGKRITPAELLAYGRDWTGIVAGVEPYTDELLAQLPRLRCISRVGTGTDSIDKAAAARRGIAIRTTPDAPTPAVAEMALALILALCRRLPWHDARLKRGQWERATGQLLGGKTVGIIGLGRIGRRVVELLAPFACPIVAVDPCPPDAAWCRQHGVRLVALPELLAAADIVTLHVSPSSRAVLLGAAELAAMKPGALLVNTARGYLVDTDAVAAALRRGQLGGAAFDVFPEEPYTGPLQTLDDVVLMPHVSTLTRETRIEMERQAIEHLLAELERP